LDESIRGLPQILRFAALQTERWRRDDPRLRPPAADGLRTSSGALASTCVCARPGHIRPVQDRPRGVADWSLGRGAGRGAAAL